MKYFFLSRRAGFTLKNMLLMTGILAVTAGWALPHYTQRMEREQARRMQTILRTVSAAEQSYYARHAQYTDRWKELSAFWNAEEMAPYAESQEHHPAEYFFAFSAFTQARRDGFIVTLQVETGGQAGVISASRTGSFREQYDLVRSFPQEETSCIALQNHSEFFCRQFLKDN